MKTIKDDPGAFWADGGWAFLDIEGGDGEGSDDEDPEDAESDFAPSNASSEEEEVWISMLAAAQLQLFQAAAVCVKLQL